MAIVGENFGRVVKQFDLDWSGTWTENEKEMIEKEAILKLRDPQSASIRGKFFERFPWVLRLFS